MLPTPLSKLLAGGPAPPPVPPVPTPMYMIEMCDRFIRQFKGSCFLANKENIKI